MAVSFSVTIRSSASQLLLAPRDVAGAAAWRTSCAAGRRRRGCRPLERRPGLLDGDRGFDGHDGVLPDVRDPDPNQPPGWRTGPRSTRRAVSCARRRRTWRTRRSSVSSKETQRSSRRISLADVTADAVQPCASSQSATSARSGSSYISSATSTARSMSNCAPSCCEPLAHPCPPVLRLHADGLGGDAAARRAELGDLLEQPVLRVAGQIHQQTLGQPRRRLRCVETGLAQRLRPVLAQVDRRRGAASPTG